MLWEVLGDVVATSSISGKPGRCISVAPELQLLQCSASCPCCRSSGPALLQQQVVNVLCAPSARTSPCSAAEGAAVGASGSRPASRPLAHVHSASPATAQPHSSPYRKAPCTASMPVLASPCSSQLTNRVPGHRVAAGLHQRGGAAQKESGAAGSCCCQGCPTSLETKSSSCSG